MLKKIKNIMSKKEKSPNSNPENIVENTNAKTKKQHKKPTPEEKIKIEIEELNQQLAELKDKHLRLYAEFDNYKKRTLKEKVDLMKTAAQDTMSALLPVLDDFDRARKNAQDDNATVHFDSEGVLLVYNKLVNTLSHHGLKPMESNGQLFDPELHEAITEIPAPNDEMKGKIIDTIEKGYFLKDKLIRHAKVVVGK
jgi:molecular chaperone GrpE